MFKRYPYSGWLAISIILWCITGYHYYSGKHALKAENMATAVGKDLNNREQAYGHFIKNTSLVRKIFADSLSESDLGTLQGLPFYVFAYNSDSLIFWNSNEVLSDCSENDTGTKIVRNQKGVFIQECVAYSGKSKDQKLTILFPIVINYPIENDYLQSHFAADSRIPVSTDIVATPAGRSIPVYTSSGKAPQFYLIVHKEDIPHYTPDAMMVVLIIISLLASVSWLQLLIIRITEKRSILTGLNITIGVILLARGLIYWFGLPFGLRNLKFFSPDLYASSSFLPSLGDMLLNTLCMLWIIVFIIRHVPYKQAGIKTENKKLKTGIALLIMAALLVYAFGFVNSIRSLVLDSNISFDVSHFYSINIYTLLGLLTIAILTVVSCIVIYLLNTQLNNYIKRKGTKYLILVAALVLVVAPGINEHEHFYIFLGSWLFLFVVLLDVQKLEMVADLFTPHMIFWAIFVCLFSTGLLQYFNHVKERATRELFAESNATTRRDNQTEYIINKIIKSIQKDKSVKQFFLKPSVTGRRGLDEHLDAAYLRGQLSKYTAKVLVYDDKERGLSNKDTFSYSDIQREKEQAMPISNDLYFSESQDNEHYYLAVIPILYDSATKKTGHIFVNLVLKKARNEIVYLELLQPAGAKTSQSDAEFPYAIYENGKLISHTSNYPFPDYLRQDTPSNKYTFYSKQGASELWYNDNDKKTVVVAHFHNPGLELITLFSYLFGIEILLAVIIMLYQLYLSYLLQPGLRSHLIRFTLRRRIHFSMLFVVLVSFLIIGVVTIAFFTDQYKNNNKAKLESAMQTVQQSIQLYMNQSTTAITEHAFDSISHTNKFKGFAAKLASDLKIDLNIYNIFGAMEVTSQEEIYDRGLLARLIRPDAYYQLDELSKSLLIQNEKIGKLSYLSCYVPLHDQNGNPYGYMNVPFFSSEKELNLQISNIVVTLINLYAFIFLFSSFLTIFITRWLTRTFNIIIRQFGMLNLQRNERINWPYDDEIGMLVKEYNKMVKTLEENAVLLAQSERESAWREMAKQVAHEIKNPLTPMRLNIQHLQQALHANHPDAKQLAEKVSDSLIEQIDSLSYIASEFSNFAKMPEARTEELDLNNVIDIAMELYKNDSNIMLSINKYGTPLQVISDKSQLMRVFTNLIENAKQAVPQGTICYIAVESKVVDGYAQVSVNDNGMGISPEAQKKIFQPYFTTKTSGTGLGLTMSKKIVEFWKGDIWFETTVGKGTTFFIKLPLLKKEE
jgi:signal transduction histidine kinase